MCRATLIPTSTVRPQSAISLQESRRSPLAESRLSQDPLAKGSDRHREVHRRRRHRKARVPIFSPALATPHKQSSGSRSRRAPEKAAHTSLSLLERYPSKNAPAKRHQRTSATQFCSSPQTSRYRDTETSINSSMQPAVEHGQGTPKFARIRRAPRVTTPPRSPERALQDVLR